MSEAKVSWADVLTPPSLASSPEVGTRACIWSAICVTAAALAGGVAAVHFHEARWLQGLAVTLGALSWLALTADLHATGNLHRTTHASCALSIGLVLQSALIATPLTLPTLAFFGMIPFLSLVGVRRRDSTLWSLAALPLPALTLSMSGGLGGSEASGAFSFTFLFAGVGAMTWTFESLAESARKDRVQVLKNLAEATSRTGDLVESKQQFVKNVSHEFRTPLNHIMGAAQLLSETPLNDEQRDLLSIAERSGEDLLCIIDEAVDVHDLEHGDLQLEPAWLDVHLLLSRATRPHSGTAEKKGLRLVVEVDPALPERLRGDVRRLEQILDNLLENAVAFTDSGAIFIRVSYLGAGGVRFEIEDSGAGIAEGRFEEIFEPFRQVDESDTRHHGGLGAGLALCRRLARLMDGDISVRSKVGTGSTFTFTAWLGVESLAQASEQSENKGRQIHNAHVLLAEPNPRTRKGFLSMLQRMGLTAEGVDSQTMLYARYAEGNYDVVFVDLELPGPHPLEQTMARLAELKDRSQTFLVALSRYETTGDVLVAPESFDDHLPKPLRREQVLDTLHRWAALETRRVA